MGARIPLPDGRKVPVSDDYARAYQGMSAAERRAEFPALIRQADKLGIQPAGKDQPPAGAEPSSPPPPAGTEQPADAQQSPQVNTGLDVLQSAGAGFRRGLEGIVATPQDLYTLGGRGLSWLTGNKFNESDYDIPGAPSSEDIHKFTTDLGVGESYVPQTRWGKYAGSVGEFAGGAVGPGLYTSPLKSAIRLGTTALGGGLASEAAGELAEGTRFEGPARLVAGVAGAGAAGAGRGAGTHAVEAPARKVEQGIEDAAREQGVELTRGQRTGDPRQQQREEQMRGGAKGGLAQRLMLRRQREQLEALKDASLSLTDQAAPMRGGTPVESASNLGFSTRRRVEQAKKAGGAKIESALKGGGVMIDADRLRNLPDELKTKLTGADPDLPEHTLDDLTPVSNTAMARIDKFAKLYEDPAKFSELSLQKVDRLRRQVIDLAGDAAPGSTDARALSSIIDHFDDWLLDATGKGSIKQGPNVQGGRTTSQVAAELKAGQQEYKGGKRVEEPRGADKQEPGAGLVSRLAKGRMQSEDINRLFTPNDRGELSGSAIDALDRLRSTGASSADLDQVRHIILEKLTTGDPGKLVTRIENFRRNNPSAASLFKPEELETLGKFGETNKRLVPAKEATNPSRSSYGVIDALNKVAATGMAGVGAKVGSLFGPMGTAAGAAAGGAIGGAGPAIKGFFDARKALKPATRMTLAEEAAKAAVGDAARGGRRGLAGVNQVTINDPQDPHHGETATIISEGKNGFKVRLPNGQEKLIGKALVK